MEEEEGKRNENTEIKLPSIATAVKLNPKEMKDGAEKFQLSFWGFIWNLWMKLVSYCEIHAQTNNPGEIDIFYTEVVLLVFYHEWKLMKSKYQFRTWFFQMEK